MPKGDEVILHPDSLVRKKPTEDPEQAFAEYVRYRYANEWPPGYINKAKERHAVNVHRCLASIAEYERKDRPIRVLAISGSPRSPEMSCAHEISNSEMLMEHGLDALREQDDVEIDSVRLSEYFIEKCNGCLSTTSGLCGFPCNCWHFDGMHDLYPKVLRSDVLLMSTGVNQSAMAGPLKHFCDRLVSLDGGFFVSPEQFKLKDAAWREACIDIGVSHDFEYNARLYGRVCGYFISSKDDANPSDQWNGHPHYVKMVVESLWDGFLSYDCHHAEPHYAAVVGKWDEDYAFDKARLQQDQRAQKRAVEVAEAAVELVRKYRRNPESKPAPSPGRVNRV